jgi:hypothetical protein
LPGHDLDFAQKPTHLLAGNNHDHDNNRNVHDSPQNAKPLLMALLMAIIDACCDPGRRGIAEEGAGAAISKPALRQFAGKSRGNALPLPIEIRAGPGRHWSCAR